MKGLIGINESVSTTQQLFYGATFLSRIEELERGHGMRPTWLLAMPISGLLAGGMGLKNL